MGKKPKYVVQELPSSDEEADDGSLLDEDDEFASDDADDGLGGGDEARMGQDADDDVLQTADMPPKKKKGSQRPAREPIYDVDGLHEKLEDVGWDEGSMAWDETQAITSQAAIQVDNVDDDIARELAFYTQALDATREAIARFTAAGTPWLRPQDYYAEMVKSDSHMAKVKQQLMHEQRLIEQAEERRKQREAKQYSKEVQAERNKERAAHKKQQIQGMSKLRKQRENTGYVGEVDYDAELAALDKRAPFQPGKYRDRATDQKPAPGKKRQARNAKFGFGGSKKLKKQNDALSSAAVDGFKQGRFAERAGPRKGGKPGERWMGKSGGGSGPGGAKRAPMKVQKRQGKAGKSGKAGRAWK